MAFAASAEQTGTMMLPQAELLPARSPANEPLSLSDADVQALQRSYAIVSRMIGPTAKEREGLMKQRAELQDKIDVERQECRDLAKEYIILQLELVELDAEKDKAILRRINRVRDEKRAEVAQLEHALRHGSYIVRGPPGSGKDTILVDSRFLNIVLANNNDGVTFTLNIVHGVSHADLQRLPSDLRLARKGEHEAVLDCVSLIPFPDKGAVVELVRDDVIETWDDPTHGEEFEVFTPYGEGGGLAYSGTFVRLKPLPAYKKEVTGPVQEIFDNNVVTQAFVRSDNPKLQEIRLQWRNPHNKLRFRVLRYKGFNQKFLSEVQAFFSSSAQQKTV